MAAKQNSKEIGEILIKKGANIHATDIFSQNLIISFLNYWKLKLIKEIK